jgi:hypothetical protein
MHSNHSPFLQRRGPVCVVGIFLGQAMHVFQLPNSSPTRSLLGQTTGNLPCARYACRSDQRKIGTAGGKCALTAATDHSPSTGQATDLAEDGSASPGASCQDGPNLETGTLPGPGRRRSCGFHRELFRLFWKRKSKACARKSKLSPETICLIKEMAAKNRRLVSGAYWGRTAQVGCSREQTNHPEVDEAHWPETTEWAELENVLAPSCGRGVGL